jgi:hypothetical protein
MAVALLLLLTVTLVHPPEVPAADCGNNAPGGTDAPVPAQEEAARAGSSRTTGEQEALQTLKHRYRQDHTGVRARLGMCRNSDGEPSCGQHRHRFRGGREQEP